MNKSKQCQHLSVPTQPRHPVDVFYLEDMMSMDYGVQTLAKSLLEYHDEKLRIELEEAIAEASAAETLLTRANDEDEGLLLDDTDSDTDSDDDSEANSEYVSPTSPAARLQTLRRAVSTRSQGNADFTSLETKPRPDEREAGQSIVKLVAKLALQLSTYELDCGRKGSEYHEKKMFNLLHARI